MNADHASPPDAEPSPSTAARDPVVDRKFVRITDRRDNGLVAFEFSVGWPDLAAELVMPEPMFEAFCEKHQVEFLTGPAAPQLGEVRGDD